MGDTNYLANVTKKLEDVEHHGVKGMKWGVRNDKGHEGEKAKTKTIAKADKKYNKSLTGMAGFIKVNNSVAHHINPKLDVLNAKPEYSNVDMTTKPALHKKYINEYRSALEQSLNESMDEIGTNASGTQRIHLTMVGEGLDTSWQAYTEALKHDAFSDGFDIVPEFDANGQIVDQTIKPKTIEHHGIKGMKWGIRKDRGSTEIIAPGKGPSGESSAQKYVRLNAHAKKHGANSLDDDDLRFVTQRGNAIAQVNRLNEKKPGWIADLAKSAIKQQANKHIQSLSDDLSKKYVDTSKSSK